MPITCDYEALALATRLPDAEMLRREMAGVADFLPGRPPIRTFTGTFVYAFQSYFSIEFRPGIQRPVDPVIA
jgi:hypothetical protein